MASAPPPRADERHGTSTAEPAAKNATSSSASTSSQPPKAPDGIGLPAEARLLDQAALGEIVERRLKNRRRAGMLVERQGSEDHPGDTLGAAGLGDCTLWLVLMMCCTPSAITAEPRCGMVMVLPFTTPATAFMP